MDTIEAAAIVERAASVMTKAKEFTAAVKEANARPSVAQLKKWAEMPTDELVREIKRQERKRAREQARLQKMADQHALMQLKTTCEIIGERLEDEQRVQYYELAAEHVPWEKRDLAREIMEMATDNLATKTPRIRWYTPESTADALYKMEYGADDFEGFRHSPIAGMAQFAKAGRPEQGYDIWLNAELSLADTAYICAHECGHADPSIGRDEKAADAFAMSYIHANPELGVSALYQKDVDRYFRAIPDMGYDPNAPVRDSANVPNFTGNADGSGSVYRG
jgi:hypothetical protein